MRWSPAARQGLDELRRTISPADESFASLRAHYRTEDGICDFVREVIGTTPRPYQERILKAVVRERRVAVRSLHGVGKTALASWVVLWVMTCFDGEVKAIMTASVWRQLTKFLLPEVRKWAKQADWGRIGVTMRDKKELLKQSITLPGKEAFAVASNHPSAIEGAHAKTLLYVFDEAKAIPDATFDAIEGAFANAGEDTDYEAFALAISTPGAPLGRFYDIHQQKPGLRNWYVDYVTLEEALESGQVSQAWVENLIALWGESDPRFKNRVLGEFADSGEDALIKLSWVAAAVQRWHERNGEGDPDEDVVWACDPADDGKDKTAICRLRGTTVELLKYYDMDTMAAVNEIARLMSLEHGVSTKRVPVGIDSIGVGAGVYSRLRELRYSPTSIKASSAAKTRSGRRLTDSSGQNTFRSLRDYGWWSLREALDPASPAFANLALPPDPLLEQDLIAPTWGESMGVIRVESKDDTRQKIDGRSTDGADAVWMAWYMMMLGKHRPRIAAL